MFTLIIVENQSSKNSWNYMWTGIFLITMTHFLTHLSQVQQFSNFRLVRSDSPASTVNISPELVFDWLVPFVSCFVEQIRNFLPSFWLTNSTILNAAWLSRACVVLWAVRGLKTWTIGLLSLCRRRLLLSWTEFLTEMDICLSSRKRRRLGRFLDNHWVYYTLGFVFYVVKNSGCLLFSLYKARHMSIYPYKNMRDM